MRFAKLVIPKYLLKNEPKYNCRVDFVGNYFISILGKTKYINSVFPGDIP